MNHAVSHKWDPCPRRPGRLFVACRSGDEEDKKPVSGDFGGAAWPLWQVMIMNRRACTMMFATAVTLFGVAQAAHAFSLKLVSKKIAAPGVEVRHYTTIGPTTRLWVAFVDLCKARIQVDATKAPKSFSTTGAWAAKRGAALAVNGDFHKSGPRVYGQGVVWGVQWPDAQVSVNAKWKGEWFWRNQGWIAFMHDEVKFSHSQHTKTNASKLGVKAGWSPTAVTTAAARPRQRARLLGLR